MVHGPMQHDGVGRNSSNTTQCHLVSAVPGRPPHGYDIRIAWLGWIYCMS